MKHVDQLGNAIRRARMEKRLTQEELAEQLDITPTHLKHLESGHRKPSVEVLFHLAVVLNLSLDQLLFPESGQGPEEQELQILFSQCTEKEKQLVLEMIRAVLRHR